MEDETCNYEQTIDSIMKEMHASATTQENRQYYLKNLIVK